MAVSVSDFATDQRLPVHTKRRVFDNGITVADLTQTGSDKIVVTFQPFMAAGFDKRGFGEDFFPPRGYDVLCFKPRDDSWYQDLLADDLRDEGFAFLKDYRERIGYGSSMGAYGVLYLSDALGLDRVIAVSPQYSIDRNVAPFENRWQSLAADIRFVHRWSHAPYRARTVTIYDPFDNADARHVEFLRAKFPNGVDIALPFTGHPSLSALVESGQISSIIESLISGAPVDVRSIKREIRKQCKLFYAEWALHYARVQKPRHLLRAFAYFCRVHVSDRPWILAATIRIGDELSKQNRIGEAYSIAAIALKSLFPEISSSTLQDSENLLAAAPPELQVSVDRWLSGLRRVYRGDDPSLATVVGIRESGSIHATGQSGVLLYGPYANLDEGQYRVVVRGSIDNPGTHGLIVKVTAAAGTATLGEAAISSSVPNWEQSFLIESNASLTGVETLVVVSENSSVRVDEVEIAAQNVRARLMCDESASMQRPPRFKWFPISAGVV
jgi:hypothetical protein